jgi:hypothetical protein
MSRFISEWQKALCSVHSLSTLTYAKDELNVRVMYQDRCIAHNIAVIGRYLEKEFPGAYITDEPDQEGQCHMFTVITLEQGQSFTLMVANPFIRSAVPPSLLYTVLMERSISDCMRKNRLYKLRQ